MLISCKGIFENGEIKLLEAVPIHVRTEVIVTFLEPDIPFEKMKEMLEGQSGEIGGLKDGFTGSLED
ncbi:MAG TPA: hypothetical protein PK509_15160 [Catalimonadaceae bacterium]|nr:hypothetical protein [Catalimonadaceae bacterium]